MVGITDLWLGGWIGWLDGLEKVIGGKLNKANGIGML